MVSLNAITDPVVNGVPGVSYMNGLIMSYPYYLFALPNIMSSVCPLYRSLVYRDLAIPYAINTSLYQRRCTKGPNLLFIDLFFCFVSSILSGYLFTLILTF